MNADRDKSSLHLKLSNYELWIMFYIKDIKKVFIFSYSSKLQIKRKVTSPNASVVQNKIS